MGKPDTKGTQQAEKTIAEEEVKLGEASNVRSQQLFDIGLPGLKTATSHYTDLASGDPTAIFKAVAPGVQQMGQQFDVTKAKLGETMPRGGARDLAMAETDISKAGAAGTAINEAYNQSFDKLAAIAGKNMGLSQNDIAAALSAFGGASNTFGNIANQQESGKAATLGFLGSLGGGAMEMAAMA